MDRTSLDNQIFTWGTWDQEGPMSMQFGDVELKVQVGEFPAGTKFPAAFLMGDASLLVLLDDKQQEHAFDLKVNVGERVEPEHEECGEGCTHH